MPIDQKITQLPEPPTSTDASNFRERADAFVSALPVLGEELNTFAQQANELEETVNAAEQDAVAARIVAIAAQNFDGDWDSAKAYKHPVSVRYNGRRYASLQDSTGKQPDVETMYWMQIDGIGSRLDADYLGGKRHDTFAQTDLSNVTGSTLIKKVKEVDGEGSGLDADLVRGNTPVILSSDGLKILKPDASVIKNQLTAWVVYDGVNAAIIDSFNISSVIKNGAGDYTFNFSGNMNNTNYCVIGTSNYADIRAVSKAQSAVQIRTYGANANGLYLVDTIVEIAIVGGM